MKIKTNTRTPQLQINWKHVSLVVLHLVVFIFSVLADEFITAKGTAGALPKTLLIRKTEF